MNKFFIEVSLEAKTIKIEKDAKKNIFKEKHGKYKMALSKFEAKNFYGFNFEIAMLETIKEISSRTGSYDEASKKWIKDTSDEAKSKWYKADYEKARIKK